MLNIEEILEQATWTADDLIGLAEDDEEFDLYEEVIERLQDQFEDELSGAYREMIIAALNKHFGK